MDTDAAKVYFPPPLLFGFFIAIGWCCERFVLSTHIPDLFDGLGWSLNLLALIILTFSLKQFRQTHQRPEPWKQTPELIVTGIYAYSRNPMYLAMALLQVGTGFIVDNLWVIALVSLSTITVYGIAIKPEEKYLSEKFGQVYLDYMKCVGRWF